MQGKLKATWRPLAIAVALAVAGVASAADVKVELAGS